MRRPFKCLFVSLSTGYHSPNEEEKERPLGTHFALKMKIVWTSKKFAIQPASTKYHHFGYVRSTYHK
jgi:hypothetical protein